MLIPLYPRRPLDSGPKMTLYPGDKPNIPLELQEDSLPPGEGPWLILASPVAARHWRLAPLGTPILQTLALDSLVVAFLYDSESSGQLGWTVPIAYAWSIPHGAA